MLAMKNPSILWLDVAVVLGFVIAGRRTHDEAETLAGILRTAAPFMLALAAGWAVTSAWRRPASLSVGGGVLVTTVVVGMLLRRFLFVEGTAATFIVVATLFLALGLLGWRTAAKVVLDRRRRVTSARSGASEPVP